MGLDGLVNVFLVPLLIGRLRRRAVYSLMERGPQERRLRPEVGVASMANSPLQAV